MGCSALYPCCQEYNQKEKKFKHARREENMSPTLRKCKSGIVVSEEDLIDFNSQLIQEFDTLGRFKENHSSECNSVIKHKAQKGNRVLETIESIDVKRIGFIFGKLNNSLELGLIGISQISITKMKNKQAIAEQYMIMMLKDFYDVQEVQIDMKDSQEIVTEISISHNGSYITAIEVLTNQDQVMSAPNEQISFAEQSQPNFQTFKLNQGLLGFCGTINVETGFINSISTIQKQQGRFYFSSSALSLPL